MSVDRLSRYFVCRCNIFLFCVRFKKGRVYSENPFNIPKIMFSEELLSLQLQ